GARAGRFSHRRFHQAGARSAMKFSRSSFPISSRRTCRMVRGAISLALAWVGLFAATICNGSVASRVWSALLQSLRQSMARGGRTFVLPNCCDGPAWLNYVLTAHSCAISIVTLRCSIEFGLPRYGRRLIWRFFPPRAHTCLLVAKRNYGFHCTP